MPAGTNIQDFGEFRELMATPEPPELGPGPRSGVLALDALNEKLDAFLARHALPPAVHQLIRSALLLWHDHLDASHRLSQDLHTVDGSFLHGIMHRREPDYGNSKYWFHRVGRHPVFSELAEKATALLDSKSEKALQTELLPGGNWDPFAFVDACEKVAGRGSQPRTDLLRSIQALEFELLLARFWQSGQQSRV
jgi:hypothetical protein